jgi:hypothetical protein
MRLTEITIDPSLQMRVTMDQAVVDDYAQALLRGDKFPPIVIFPDGNKNYVGDGNNRYFAHKQAGIPEIEVIVKQGGYDEAFKYALGVANHENGQRYNNADKRKGVMKAITSKIYANASDRDLSKLCKVSHTFVSNVRKELGKERDSVVAVRDGKKVTMNLPKQEKVEVDEPEIIQEDPVLAELSHTISELAEENKKLEARVAIAAMDATAEEKISATQIISDLQEQVKILEADNRVLKASRDSFQAEAVEAKKQALYGKRRYEKAEREVESLTHKVNELQRKLDLAEADLAMR